MKYLCIIKGVYRKAPSSRTYRKKPVRIQESIIGIFLRTEKDAIAYYQSPYIITTEVLQQNALEP
ncbi:hypothetical protein, partial [Crocosphaera watsonii]|uniref:hypothetical protein n=1 Tax=Crocosphaera watsonii TaxID=263511 RepID=UPI0030DBE820